MSFILNAYFGAVFCVILLILFKRDFNCAYSLLRRRKVWNIGGVGGGQGKEYWGAKGGQTFSLTVT